MKNLILSFCLFILIPSLSYAAGYCQLQSRPIGSTFYIVITNDYGQVVSQGQLSNVEQAVPEAKRLRRLGICQFDATESCDAEPSCFWGPCPGPGCWVVHLRGSQLGDRYEDYDQARQAARLLVANGLCTRN